jgi:hypothetical protein
MIVRNLLTAAAAAAALLPAHAAINVATAAFTYTQTFDTLAASGTPTWANDTTLAGWGLYTAAGTAVPSYATGDGSSNTGSFYSFGTVGSAERALGGTASGGTYFGSPASGALAGYIAVSFTNGTGGGLTGFRLGFDGEQWRNGGNTSSQAMVLQYGFGTSFGSVANWVQPGGNFDWSSPVVGSTAAAVDGNGPGKVAGRGGSINTAWAAGDTLWVRWIDNNDVGNDHGLAIDNLSLSVSAVPEPATALLLGLGAVVLAGFRRRAQGAR